MHWVLKLRPCKPLPVVLWPSREYWWSYQSQEDPGTRAKMKSSHHNEVHWYTYCYDEVGDIPFFSKHLNTWSQLHHYNQPNSFAMKVHVRPVCWWSPHSPPLHWVLKDDTSQSCSKETNSHGQTRSGYANHFKTECKVRRHPSSLFIFSPR